MGRVELAKEMMMLGVCTRSGLLPVSKIIYFADSRICLIYLSDRTISVSRHSSTELDKVSNWLTPNVTSDTLYPCPAFGWTNGPVIKASYLTRRETDTCSSAGMHRRASGEASAVDDVDER